MYTDVGFLKTDIIMFIYLQKCHHIFGNLSFWFNGHCIDDVEVLFSTSVMILTHKKIIFVKFLASKSRKLAA